jgi:acetylornithine deacetylase/succinyl-diaminopimelate desuccinylase-like protein
MEHASGTPSNWPNCGPGSPDPAPDGRLARVLAQIDPEALARDCLAYVSVKSETGDEGAGAEFLAGLMRRRGWGVVLEDVQPGRPNVVAHLPGSGGGPNLMFNGHVDTIPIGQAWPPRRDGSWIWGRGAEDMKGGLVAMVHAISAIQSAGLRLRGDLWLTGVVGHETPVGKKEGPLRLIEQIRAGALRPDAILIVEGPPAIWSASLGSTIFTLTLEADRGPIHTIKVPYKENPVRWLARVLDEIDRLDDRLASVPPHPLAGPDQVNVGIVSAGDYFNRLPVHLSITGTRRWGLGRTVEDVRGELREIAQRVARASGLRYNVELAGAREPFETPRTHPLILALERVGWQIGGQAHDVIGMGLVGDANLYVNEGGVPTVYFGPAYETAHSDEERVDVGQLAKTAGVYALAAIEYCGVQGDMAPT